MFFNTPGQPDPECLERTGLVKEKETHMVVVVYRSMTHLVESEYQKLLEWVNYLSRSLQF